MSKTDNKPIFTLTAEEVEIVKDALEDYKDEVTPFSFHELNKDYMNTIENLLTRIKQWQDDNSKDNKGNKQNS